MVVKTAMMHDSVEDIFLWVHSLTSQVCFSTVRLLKHKHKRWYEMQTHDVITEYLPFFHERTVSDQDDLKMHEGRRQKRTLTPAAVMISLTHEYKHR